MLAPLTSIECLEQLLSTCNGVCWEQLTNFGVLQKGGGGHQGNHLNSTCVDVRRGFSSDWLAYPLAIAVLNSYHERHSPDG